MRCTQVQSRLLALPDPARVPEALRPHLDACPACRAWHSALVRFEAALPALPVPSGARGKAMLLRRLQADAGPVVPQAPPRPAVQPRRSFAAAALRYWHGAAVAATVLVATAAYLSIGSRLVGAAPVPPDPYLARMLALNVKLGSVETADEPVRLLAQIASELHQEMLDVAMIVPADKSPDDSIGLLHKLYQDLLGRVGEKAATVQGPRGREVLREVADQLRDAAVAAEQRSDTVPPQAKRVLREVASASQATRERIRQILEGGT